MFTTVERLKKMPGFAMEADDYLTLLIAAASAAIEAYVNRKLAVQEESERHNGTAMTPFIHLSRYPVVQLHEIRADGIEIVDADLLSPDLGRLYRKSGWPAGIGNITVTYQGGYSLPGNADANLPENIELACILQVQQLMRTPGVISERVGDIAVTYTADKLCSSARSLLDGHRRFA